ncbi:MAG TPA: restriction endonuclease subunit S [Thermoanaerobaculia bacterium]|nr:restriction endonuclease subunit S [Thermoanaerobaculia bacterium]
MTEQKPLRISSRFGMIPGLWEEERLRWFIQDIGQGWSPEAEDRPPLEGEWCVLKLNAIQRGKFDETAVKTLPFGLEAPDNLQVRSGDVLVTRANTPSQVGDVCFVIKVQPRVILSDLVYRLRLREDRIDGRFLSYFLLSQMGRSQIEKEARGTSNSMVKISQEHIKSLWFPVPPRTQQQLIADYLDRETARLDALVTAKERVLGLLAEKRRALITHAVTRGLNPRAPLRNSGISWLGTIPAHWRIERLKFHLHWIEQGWSPMCDSMPATLNEWGVLKAGCVNDWDFDPNDNKRLPDNLEPLPQYEVRQGDVLMSRANTTALLGSTALVGEVRPRLLLCDKLYRLGVNDFSLFREYLVAFLRSSVGRYEFERDATGASNSMQNIGQDSVRNLWLPIPPIEEQRVIVSRLTVEAGKLDAMRRAIEHTVRLLKERRVALIAAAVTGQIDGGAIA